MAAGRFSTVRRGSRLPTTARPFQFSSSAPCPTGAATTTTPPPPPGTVRRPTSRSPNIHGLHQGIYTPLHIPLHTVTYRYIPLPAGEETNLTIATLKVPDHFATTSGRNWFVNPFDSQVPPLRPLRPLRPFRSRHVTTSLTLRPRDPPDPTPRFSGRTFEPQ